MNCQKCNSEHVLTVSGKVSDLCFVQFPDGSERDGYVPRGLRIGGGDYLDFAYCLDCGVIQGDFPIPEADRKEFYTL
jgi:hypothetical protein